MNSVIGKRSNGMARKLKSAILTMESMMSPESVQRSHQKAEQEILSIKSKAYQKKRRVVIKR